MATQRRVDVLVTDLLKTYRAGNREEDTSHEFVLASALDRVFDELKSGEIEALRPHIVQLAELFGDIIASSPKWHMRMTAAVAACVLFRDYTTSHEEVLYGTTVPGGLLEICLTQLGNEKPEVRETVAQAVAAAGAALPLKFDAAVLPKLIDQLLTSKSWEYRDGVAYTLGFLLPQRPDCLNICLDPLITGTGAAFPPFYCGTIRHHSIDALCRFLRSAIANGIELPDDVPQCLVNVGFARSRDDRIEAARAAARLISLAAQCNADLLGGVCERALSLLRQSDATQWRSRYFSALVLGEIAGWLVAHKEQKAHVLQTLEQVMAEPPAVIIGESPTQANGECLVAFYNILIKDSENSSANEQILARIINMLNASDTFLLDAGLRTLSLFVRSHEHTAAALDQHLDLIWPRVFFSTSHQSIAVSTLAQQVAATIAQRLAHGDTVALSLREETCILGELQRMSTECKASDTLQGVYGSFQSLFTSAPDALRRSSKLSDPQVIMPALFSGIFIDLLLDESEDVKVAAAGAIEALLRAVETCGMDVVQFLQPFTQEFARMAQSAVGMMLLCENASAAFCDLLGRVAQRMPTPEFLSCVAPAVIAAVGSPLITIRSVACATSLPLIASLSLCPQPLTLMLQAMPPVSELDSMVAQSVCIGLLLALCEVPHGCIRQTLVSTESVDRTATQTLVALICKSLQCYGCGGAGEAGALVLLSRMILKDNADPDGEVVVRFQTIGCDEINKVLITDTEQAIQFNLEQGLTDTTESLELAASKTFMHTLKLAWRGTPAVFATPDLKLSPHLTAVIPQRRYISGPDEAPFSFLLTFVPYPSPLALFALWSPLSEWARQAAIGKDTPAQGLTSAFIAGNLSEIHRCTVLTLQHIKVNGGLTSEEEFALPLLGALEHFPESEAEAAVLASAAGLLGDKNFRFRHGSEATALVCAIPYLVSDVGAQQVVDWAYDARIDESSKLIAMRTHLHGCVRLLLAGEVPRVPPLRTPVDTARDNSAFDVGHAAEQGVA